MLLLPCLIVVSLALLPSASSSVGEDLDARLNKIIENMQHMGRQMMLQQFFVEERIRSEGNSGIKLTRLTHTGTKSYHSNTFTGKRAVAVHNHANHISTVGLGEFIAVLNGVEFRTRHNDYKLVKPQTITANNTIEYNKVDYIDFPEVPPSVKGTVDEQIAEMGEYFRAFSEQNTTHRDYRKYFKPLLCYLEGGWTISDDGKIEESFDSDRHSLDADTWLDMQEKVRYTSYTGRKDRLENYAYLPTTITKVVDGRPVLAQWNYRILCHPLKNDLSTKRLVLVDDVENRMAYKKTLADYENSRSARFRLAPVDEDNWTEGLYSHTLLDDLMKEIPGKNGYGNILYDDGITESRAKDSVNQTEDLNAGYYHRWFKAAKDAMGSDMQHRGFSDDTLFVAATTHEKIAPAEATYCKRKKQWCKANCECRTIQQRYTYAIPLEIIYMNPLQRWNPHGIDYKHDVSPKVGGKSGRSEGGAFEHTSKDTYNRTPLKFFKDNKWSGDLADTSNGNLFIKGKDGKAHQVVSSGLRILLPKLEGIENPVRLRYPIMPIHQEGNIMWKRHEALQELVREPEKHCAVSNSCR